MNFKSPIPILIATLFASSALITMSTQRPGFAQNPNGGSNSSQVAVSTIINQHLHSIALRTQDVDDLLALLQNNSETFGIESSSASNNGVAANEMHTHSVFLSKAQLTELKNTGTLLAPSQQSMGHSHTFQFIMPQQCPAIVVPVPMGGSTPTPPGPLPSPSGSPRPSPSPSPSITPSPSPSPSISPSPSPSLSPSPSPSPSLSPRPSPSPSITTTPTPTPTPTRTGSPFPFPTFTVIGPPRPFPTFVPTLVPLPIPPTPVATITGIPLPLPTFRAP